MKDNYNQKMEITKEIIDMAPEVAALFKMQYIRNADISKGPKGKERMKRGVMLAFKSENDKLFVGWSLCNKKDKFDKESGIGLALLRAFVWEKKENENVYFNDGEIEYLAKKSYIQYKKVPYSIRNCIRTFAHRMERYFKPTDRMKYLDQL